MASNKLYDFIIFGATGYTGKYCIEYLYKCLQSDGLKYSWAVAGRDKERTKQARDDVAQLLGTSLDNIPVIEAAVSNEDSLLQMCKSCRVLINVVGPYRLYGEPVVKACIKAGTHQVDISGEPQFLEAVQLKYHEDAEKSGVFIVGACGYDSIPTEIGVNLLKDKFSPKILNSVETYVTMQEGPHGNTVNHGTFDSAVQAVGAWNEIGPTREKLFTHFFKKPIPAPKYPIGRRLIPFREPLVGNKWCIPFWPIDKDVARRTQAFNYIHLNEEPVHVEPYMTVPNFFIILGLGFFGIFFALFAFFEVTRNLLMRYPAFFTLGMFSKEGPTRDQVLETSFAMTLVGKGWDSKEAAEKGEPPNRTIVGVVKGGNPAYVATSIALIQSAITLLEEPNNLTGKGGVLTPGVVFRKTAIADRLSRNGVTFEVVTQN